MSMLFRRNAVLSARGNGRCLPGSRKIRLLRKAAGNHAGAGAQSSADLKRGEDVSANWSATPLLQPLQELIRKIHQDKVIGEPFVIKAQRHSTPVSPAKGGAPSWYKDVKLSGDLIVENAIHNIDVCNWVAGSHPVSAYGHGKKYFPKPIPAGTLMMDGFSVEYIYENDVHLDYSQLYMHPRLLKELRGSQWYLIFGSKGTVNLTDGVFYPFEGTEPFS